jgi:hypothetical protein
MALSLLLLMLLGGVGMTTIIVEGTIFLPIKDFLKKFMPKFFMTMLDCHQCCGFWSGIFVSLFFLNPVDASGDWSLSLYNFGKNFATGCSVSLLAVFWATLMLFIESKTSINQ